MLTGVAIAVFAKNPLIVLPAAFVSHFVFDAVPHFGFHKEAGFKAALKYKITYAIIIFDVLSWLVALFLAFKSGGVAILAGLLAASPDIVWPYRYFKYERNGKIPPETWRTRFHKWIQWGERPWGILIEIAWFSFIAIMLFREVV